MIILDTNVVSEPTKPKADPRVQTWLNDQAVETLYYTATGLAESRLGVEQLPDGARKRALSNGVNIILSMYFGPRILPFDEAAAMAYASLVPRVLATGETINFADGQIAAIALVHGFTVATRDTAPFKAAGLKVINPWESA